VYPMAIVIRESNERVLRNLTHTHSIYFSFYIDPMAGLFMQSCTDDNLEYYDLELSLIHFFSIDR